MCQEPGWKRLVNHRGGVEAGREAWYVGRDVMKAGCWDDTAETEIFRDSRFLLELQSKNLLINSI